MFCSGPTKKYDQFTNLPKDKLLENTGRSHCSPIWTEKIREIYELLRKSLNIPNNYKIGFVNGSATGAMDMLFWNLLGSKPCNVLETGIFSKRWSHEIFHQLKIPSKPINFFNDNFDVNPKYDFTFTMVETANGFRWFDQEILEKIDGLKICDLTSAIFCEEIKWESLDAAGFSFQKALGGEAGLGCVVLSPKAISAIHNKFPTPRFLKITDNMFEGKINNTISLISLNDLYLNLNIFLEKGGLESAINQCKKNQQIISQLTHPLEKIPHNNSNSIVCLRPNKNTEWEFIKQISEQCAQHRIFDITGHPEHIPCWRFWIGPTMENIEPYIKHFMHIVNNAI